ncbi:MAG: hypothetical protein WC492_00550 [Candidatus Micrarchaeia archaeon]
MNKTNPSSNIGKALTRSFILYSCLHQPQTGYRLLAAGKEILLTGWSAGSFYPHIQFLLKEKLLTRKKTSSKRITYEYSTTPAGTEYLKYVSTYFKHEKLKKFFKVLISGDF